jgi:hypothetical protein
VTILCLLLVHTHEANRLLADVLIVDNQKDLNVYNADATDDNDQNKSCCGTSVLATKPAAKSCCGTSVPVPQPVAKSCCGTTVPAKTSNCGSERASLNGPADVGVDLKQVDFNEYAGSYNIYAVKV